MPEESTQKVKMKLGNLDWFFWFFFFFLKLSFWTSTENTGGTKKGMWETPHTVGGKNTQWRGQKC